MIYKMTLKDSVDTMTFNLLETPIVDKDIEGAVDNVTLDGNQYTDYLYLKKQYIQKWAIMCPDGYDELRGFYTRQFEDGEVPSYRVYYGANVTRDYTLNGDYLQFNAEGIETGITLSQLLGNAEQTTYSGKNLLSFNVQIPSSNSNMTVTHGVNNIKIVAATTAGAQYSSILFTGMDATKTYTLSGIGRKVVKGTDGRPSVQVRWRGSNDNGSTWSGWQNIFDEANPTQGAAYPFSGSMTGYTYYNIAFYNNSQTPVTVGETTEYYDVMLEQGSTATDYEPYVGGIPAPNPQFPMPISIVTGAQTVVVTGKNLFDMDDFLTAAEATYTKDGGQYSITAWGNLISIRYPLQSVKTGNTYTLSLDGVAQSTTSTRLQVYKNGSVVGTIYGGTDHQEHSYTFTADGSQYELNATYSSPFSSPVIFKDPQLELGSATAYEPYQGQNYEVNLGKNLFSVAFDSGGSTPASDTNAFTLTKPSTRTKMFNFPTALAAGTYTVSFDITSDTTSQSSTTGGIRFQLLNSSGTMISGTSAVAIGTGTKSKTWTVSEPVHAIYFYINSSEADDVSVAMTNVMLELGAQPTVYAPYFTPIELAKIGTYQDRIYKDEGKWYIEKQVGKVVLDGPAGIGQYNQTNNWFYVSYSSISADGGVQDGGIVSDYFTGTIPTVMSQNTSANGLCAISTNNIFIRNTDYTTTADYRTWLSTHNTTAYYALATPTTTEITDEALLLQLNFLASLYGGVNNISLVGTGAQGEMEVFIRDVMSVETDVVPEVPVRLTLTDDGAINACGCRRNVQLTMRETTE